MEFKKKKEFVLKWVPTKVPKGVVPPNARCHSITAVGTKLWIFGGDTDDERNARLSNEVWVYDTGNAIVILLIWKLLRLGVLLKYQEKNLILVGLTYPYFILCFYFFNQYSATLFEETKILIFGGRSRFTYLQDVQVLDTVNLTWTQIETKGPKPFIRCCHTATAIARNLILIYGGGIGEGSAKEVFSDVHILDTDTMTWKAFNPSGSITPRESHSAAYFNGKLYVYGGCTQKDETLSDFWALDIQKMSFNELHWDFIPQNRQGASYSLIGNKLYIFGGELDSVERKKTSDIMVFHLEKGKFLSGKNFTVIGKIPIPRAYHSACVIGSKIFIYGGETGAPNTPNHKLLNEIIVLDTNVCPEPLLSQIVEFVQKNENLYNQFINSENIPNELIELIKFRRKLFEMDLHAKSELEKKRKFEETESENDGLVRGVIDGDEYVEVSPSSFVSMLLEMREMLSSDNVDPAEEFRFEDHLKEHPFSEHRAVLLGVTDGLLKRWELNAAFFEREEGEGEEEEEGEEEDIEEIEEIEDE